MIEAALRRCLSVRAGVAGAERGVVLHERGLAIVLQVVDATQIDVRPGDQVRLLGEGERALEIAARVLHLALFGRDQRHDEQPARGIGAVGIDRLLRQLLGGMQIAGGKLLLRQLRALSLRLLLARREHVGGALRVKRGLLR